MENKTIRAVGYARVSTKMQLEGKDFDSIDAQKALIMRYAKTHPGIELVEIFTDPGKSGKNMARPGMQALMKRLKNRDIGCVLAYKLDRISRNNLDYAEFEKAMAELGVSVIYTNDSNPDRSPTGHLMRNMMAGFAQLEREQISQRVKDKRLELIKQGYHAGGHPPFGYICGDKKCTIAPDPGSAGQIREIFTLALGGKKPSEIAAHMLKKYGVLPTNHTRNGKPYGGRPYCENIVAKILANPTYAGFVYREKGAELYKGLHEPLVNPEDWKTIQRALKSKKHRRQIRLKANSTHILKGKLFCECGAAMTCGSSGKRTKNNGIFYYYLCSAKNREHSARQCKTSISKDILAEDDGMPSERTLRFIEENGLLTELFSHHHPQRIEILRELLLMGHKFNSEEMMVVVPEIYLVGGLKLPNNILFGLFINDQDLFSFIEKRGLFDRIDPDQFVEALNACKEYNTQAFEKLVSKLQARGDEFIKEVLVRDPDLYDDLVAYGLRISHECWISILMETDALDIKAFEASVLDTLDKKTRKKLERKFPSRKWDSYYEE